MISRCATFVKSYGRRNIIRPLLEELWLNIKYKNSLFIFKPNHSDLFATCEFFCSSYTSQLRILDLSDNPTLRKVPSVVGEITTLTRLNLSRCGLSYLPDRLSYFCYILFRTSLNVVATDIFCSFVTFFNLAK